MPLAILLYSVLGWLLMLRGSPSAPYAYMAGLGLMMALAYADHRGLL